MNPLVSVVIPTYNRAHLVLDALESVAAQTYRPLEILVVDDGSTDETVRVVERWLSERSQEDLAGRCLRQENQGGNVARNTGIASAAGEIIAFLDSDDCWLAEKISKQVDVLRGDPELGAVYCGVRHVNATSGEPFGSTERTYPYGDILAEILVRDVTAPTSTYAVRRRVFEEVGSFDTDLRARQDWDMWIRIASRCSIGAVPQPLVDYRDHPGPRTASDPTRELRGYTRIREKYAALLARQPVGVRLAARSAYLKRRGRVFHHHRISWTRGLLNLIGAVALWPFDFDTWAALGGCLIPGGLRRSIRGQWDRAFSGTALGIRSH